MAETANVDVLIEAFTEAAEESLEDVGDELNGLSIDGEIAQAALDEVGDELNDATGSAAIAGEAFDDLSGDTAQLAAVMALMDSRANSAGNELLQTSAKASSTSGVFSGLSVSVGLLNFSFMGLSGTIWAVLLPALAVLLTTLAPIIALLGGAVTAAGAFAAASAGFVATGIVTEMEMLQEALARVGEQVREIIAPMGELAGGVLLTLINQIPTMVREMMDAAGGAETLAWWIESLGLRIMSMLPDIVGFAVTLAEDVAPAIGKLLSYLDNNGGDLVESFFATFEELEPALSDFGGSLEDMLPVLLEFGTQVLSILLPALTSFTRGATDLMRRTDFGDVRDGLAVLGDAIDTIAPKFGLFVNRLIELGYQIAPIAAEHIPFMARALRQAFDLMAALIDVTGGIITALGPNGVRGAMILLAGAAAVLGGPVTAIAGAFVIAAAAAPLLTDAMNTMTSTAGELASEFGTFLTRDLPQYIVYAISLVTALLTTFSTEAYNLLVGGFTAAAKTIVDVLNDIASTVNTMLNNVLDQINQAIEAANERVPGMDMDTFESIERMEFKTGELPEQRESRSVMERSERQARELAAALNLNVEGDGPLAEWLQEQASVEQEERSAQQDRYQRRQNIGSNSTG